MKYTDILKLLMQLIPLIFKVINLVRKNRKHLSPDFGDELLPILLDFTATLTEISVNKTSSKIENSDFVDTQSSIEAKESVAYVLQSNHNKESATGL